jgi:hypothetical protein
VTSVENTEKCFKTLTSRTKDGEGSESEIAMCDRMQMYNITTTTMKMMMIATNTTTISTARVRGNRQYKYLRAMLCLVK